MDPRPRQGYRIGRWILVPVALCVISVMALVAYLSDPLLAELTGGGSSAQGVEANDAGVRFGDQGQRDTRDAQRIETMDALLREEPSKLDGRPIALESVIVTEVVSAQEFFAQPDPLRDRELLFKLDHALSAGASKGRYVIERGEHLRDIEGILRSQEQLDERARQALGEHDTAAPLRAIYIDVQTLRRAPP